LKRNGGVAYLDDPVSVRATVNCRGGGRLVTLGAPGVTIDHRGGVWIDPAGVDQTIEALVAGGASLFLFLARDGDCPPGLRLLLRRSITQAGMAFVALPIDDYCAPGAAWMRAWRRLEPMASGLLARNRAIALCCNYGAGRSGMVACYILTRLGLPVEQALSTVRQAFPESVESPLQERWLHIKSNADAEALQCIGKDRA
jgi:hypothetical protein